MENIFLSYFFIFYFSFTFCQTKHGLSDGCQVKNQDSTLAFDILILINGVLRKLIPITWSFMCWRGIPHAWGISWVL